MVLKVALVGVGAAVCVTGCGPEVLDPAELEEVCGQPAPFRVLELPPEEQPLGSFDSIARIGDRIFWVVGANEFVPSQHEHGYQRPRHTTVWATGPCGESPTIVAEDLHFVFEKPEIWPGQALGCNDETGDIVVVDAFGAREPHVVLADVTCLPPWTEHGVVSTVPHDEQTAALVLHPYADDPWQAAPESVVLADPIRAEKYHWGWRSSQDTFAVLDDEILALTPDNELVSIELPDGATDHMLSDVADFKASASGRFVLWQDTVVTNDDPDWPKGQVSLTDRETGVTTWIAETSLAWGNRLVDDPQQPGPSYARVDRDKYWGTGTRIVMLPSLETYDVPAGRFPYRYLENAHRWLVGVGDTPFDERLFLRTLESGEETLLFDGTGMWMRGRDRGLEVLEVTSWIDDVLFDQGRAWLAPYDSGEPELLAHRASIHWLELTDGRIVTTLDIHGNWIGKMVLVDPVTLEESLVDTEVFALSTRYNEADPLPPYDDAIVYAVSDGDRSGIWLTRIASRMQERAYVAPVPRRMPLRANTRESIVGPWTGAVGRDGGLR